MNPHLLRFTLYATCLLGVAVSSNATADHATAVTAQTLFKVRYHRWVAAIYDKPEILLSNATVSYTSRPEFAQIVGLGRPALPSIAEEIEQGSDMSLFLGYAIIQITGWNVPPTVMDSPRDLNAILLRRLRVERIIPEANSVPNQSSEPAR
jgi:hypothetical protein